MSKPWIWSEVGIRRFRIAAMLFVPVVVLAFLPLLPLLVHVAAAWSKPRRGVWRVLCVVSVSAAIVAATIAVRAVRPTSFVSVYAGAVVGASFALLPLTFASTVATVVRRGRRTDAIDSAAPGE